MSGNGDSQYQPTIRDLPQGERPRERLREFGPKSLSNTELIAILLRTGLPGENVLALSSRLLARFDGLAGLGRVSFAELCAERWLSEAKSSQLMAALELGRRFVSLAPQERAVINSPQDVANLAYRPTTRHYSGYLRTQAYEGTFTEVIATLLAVEWPYLDWAKRAEEAGQKPGDRYYQTWIDIHTSPGMSGFVAWLRGVVDDSAPTLDQRDKLQEIFRNVLRYEYQFFDMAYLGESWPE